MCFENSAGLNRDYFKQTSSQENFGKRNAIPRCSPQKLVPLYSSNFFYLICIWDCFAGNLVQKLSKAYTCSSLLFEIPSTLNLNMGSLLSRKPLSKSVFLKAHVLCFFEFPQQKSSQENLRKEKRPDVLIKT